MIYYELTVPFNLRADNSYARHQVIDTLIKERLNYRLPYSVHFEDVGQPHWLATVRAAAPVGMAGERCVELDVQADSLLTFKLSLAAIETSRESKKQITVAQDRMLKELLPARLAAAGLSPLSVVPVCEFVTPFRKKGLRPVNLPGMELSILARVQDVPAFEVAACVGIGKKRAFGFGQLRDLEVL